MSNRFDDQRGRAPITTGLSTQMKGRSRPGFYPLVRGSTVSDRSVDETGSALPAQCLGGPWR